MQMGSVVGEGVGRGGVVMRVGVVMERRRGVGGGVGCGGGSGMTLLVARVLRRSRIFLGRTCCLGRGHLARVLFVDSTAFSFWYHHSMAVLARVVDRSWAGAVGEEKGREGKRRLRLAVCWSSVLTERVKLALAFCS